MRRELQARPNIKIKINTRPPLSHLTTNARVGVPRDRLAAHAAVVRVPPRRSREPVMPARRVAVASACVVRGASVVAARLALEAIEVGVGGDQDRRRKNGAAQAVRRAKAARAKAKSQARARSGLQKMQEFVVLRMKAWSYVRTTHAAAGKSLACPLLIRYKFGWRNCE